MRRYHNYHNDWIMEHKDKFFSWAEMCKEYNRVFGTDIERVRFKNHCSKDLELRLKSYYYTEEMEQFLKAHYPIYGAKKTAEAFNKRFNQKRSVHTIKEKSMQLGAYLNEESFAKYREDTTKILIAYNKTNAYEVGSIGRQSNGNYRIKVGEGAWVSIGKYLYEKYIGKVPSGYQVIYLDGNKENREPSNLEMVPVSYQALMNKLGLRSSDREITKTSVKWCELHEALRKEIN